MILATLFAGLIALLVLKHLGLLTVALRPRYKRFRAGDLPKRAKKRS